MPYETIKELPNKIREHLPEHAQEIFMNAYNNAWKEYEDPTKRRGSESREEVANRVAWSAVKNTYEKKGEKWVRKVENKKESEILV